MITPTVHEISHDEAQQLRRDWQKAAREAAARRAAAEGSARTSATVAVKTPESLDRAA